MMNNDKAYFPALQKNQYATSSILTWALLVGKSHFRKGMVTKTTSLTSQAAQGPLLDQALILGPT